MERLVPDELWELFVRGGSGFADTSAGDGVSVDDRLVLAAIVYVVTAGYVWRSLPPDLHVRRRLSRAVVSASPGCAVSWKSRLL